eukprot:gnl/TRDRNA2_/TRDRNA2_177303_c1_seq1.p1 gnl/TRDRNA2_/TRDRNA2_177303_c1~~gnl/TRDRNA2_/TRDRNA2_177303_c1_seq1.p1  ORF type:complete len:184 (+),score=34.41 gnl/TRDRNA2_/TRDRNA2_177303_c1_seq1:964-1515(+)
MYAISSSSMPTLCEFSRQQLANTAWAFATLSFVNEPLLDAIADAARRSVWSPDADGKAFTSVLWALSRRRDLAAARKLFSTVCPCDENELFSMPSEAAGPLLMESEQSDDQALQLELLQVLSHSSSLGAAARGVQAARMAEAGHAQEAIALLHTEQGRGRVHGLSVQVLRACGGSASDPSVHE